MIKSRYPIINLNGYEKSSTNRTKRSPADRTIERIPHGIETLLQDEVLGLAPESGRAVLYRSRREDGDGTAHRQEMAETVRRRRHQRPGGTSRQGPQADNGLFGRGGRPPCDRAGQAKREQGTGGMAASQRQGGQRVDVQAFFIGIGAGYKRIRKRPRGKPSPQLYEYKAGKLQELEKEADDGKTDLYYADESHVCTEGYVPLRMAVPRRGCQRAFAEREPPQHIRNDLQGQPSRRLHLKERHNRREAGGLPRQAVHAAQAEEDRHRAR